MCKGVEENNKGGSRGAIFRALLLTGSLQGIRQLLMLTNNNTKVFSIALNCNCFYDLLYVHHWHIILAYIIDKILTVKMNNVLIVSVNRRRDNGVDLFLEDMMKMKMLVGTGGSMRWSFVEYSRKIIIWSRYMSSQLKRGFGVVGVSGS